jgi:hypothetical protein
LLPGNYANKPEGTSRNVRRHIRRSAMAREKIGPEHSKHDSPSF